MIGIDLERGMNVKRLCGNYHKAKPVEVVFESAGASVITLKEIVDWIEKYEKEYKIGDISPFIKGGIKIKR